MKTSVVIYKGGLRTEASHELSGKQVITDAPLDNQGKGEAFSPTDLMSTSLGCCMLTIMGIVAERNAIDITGTKTEITKIMGSGPRRVVEIQVAMMFARNYSTKERELLENAAVTCPVAKSLHPDLKQTIHFSYPL
jgi:putative redox protein